MKLYKATEAWKLLNGVFCVYKRPSETIEFTKQKLKQFLCEDLNQLYVRPPGSIVQDIIKPNPMSGELEIVQKLEKMDYADHPLVVGDRYQSADLIIETLPQMEDMGSFMSGVCVMGVNDGCDDLAKISKSTLINVYELNGLLGRETLDFTNQSKVMEKSAYDHVSNSKFNRILARVQSNYQVSAFDYAGVSLDSQEAYELASKGLIRPKEKSTCIFYGIKLMNYKRPEFSLEVQVVNESENFLKTFIHELGISLRTNACCTKIRKIRHGNFTLAHALLWKHWTLENILNNIALCRPLLEKDKLLPSDTIRQYETQETLTPALSAPDSSELLSDDEERLSSVKNWRMMHESGYPDTEHEAAKLLEINEPNYKHLIEQSLLESAKVKD